MAQRNRPHILISQPATSEGYRRPGTGGSGASAPAPSDRPAHAQQILQQLQSVEVEASEHRAERQSTIAGAVDGLYVVFESFPGIQLALKPLDPRQGKSHPELVSVQEFAVQGEIVERATVFVPDGKLGYFVKRLEQYAETANLEKPKNRNLVDRIHSIRLASIEALWTDPPDRYPEPSERVWWEIWLRRRDGNEVDRFRVFAERSEIQVGQQILGFADRTVILAHATVQQLSSGLDLLDDLAELRRPHEPSQLLALDSATDQAEWVQQLADRTRPADEASPAVCVVDTGVHREHPLLEGSLGQADCHACDPRWAVGDHHGHGTEMAGLALYGDLGEAIPSNGQVRLRHRLESVKLLPPGPHNNPPELYGAITATAASLVEVEAPERRRVFSLATTADGDPNNDAGVTPVVGQPTAWSASIDALSAGRAIDQSAEGLVFLDEAEDAARRLFFISAGNVEHAKFTDEYLERSDLEPVQDPAQAWNAVTVGAYTKMDSLASAGSEWQDWTPLASRGELSPFSRTSVAFSPIWPVKPDVVLEGGNVARSPAGTTFDTPEVLQVLTTNRPVNNQRLLTVTCATSAATAQAAHLGASILADYPALWPETIRALIVHSAEWTPAMRSRISSANGRAGLRALVRRYGMGVPDMARATRSASDALTLVAQDNIHPYADGKMRELHLHDLPWPTDILAGLGDAAVRLRVTLSYFIQPNPARRGWRQRYNYASHGLRFDVRRPSESRDDFRKRINVLALAENENRPQSASDTGDWLLGPTVRSVGSLHTDTWVGLAADLAARGAIAVYPVAGWWKDNPRRDRSEQGARYALVVSIETPDQDVDIWTPVAQEVGISTTIET